ncbi:TPA: hypothetical protein ACPHW8_000240 [Vibrio alginolyticus]
MKYSLRILALGDYPEVNLTQEEYDSIIHAQKVLHSAMALEEKYEVLISNFLELEKDSLCLTANYMMGRTQNYNDFFDVRSTFNRRIVNLLTSTRLYLDQYCQHVKDIDAELASDVKKEFSAQYDTNFSYRFMEALRNYVQHRGLAVHKTTHPSQWVDFEGKKLLEHQTLVFALRDSLEEDPAFKKSVLREMPEKVELLSASRKYVSSIGYVHMYIREHIATLVTNAREKISSTISNYEKINNDRAIGLCVFAYKDNSCVNRKFLTLEWDNVRCELVRKNNKIHCLGESYVSGKAVK